MHIRSLIFASVSFLAAGLAYCASAIAYPFELARDHWPDYIPVTASESIALDAAYAEAEAAPSPLARFHAFLERALRQARYSAGGFQTPASFAAS